VRRGAEASGLKPDHFLVFETNISAATDIA
jgi:hypothetical protein